MTVSPLTREQARAIAAHAKIDPRTVAAAYSGRRVATASHAALVAAAAELGAPAPPPHTADPRAKRPRAPRPAAGGTA